eukprot:scaffold248522_cov79-Cyclotella_meneghiniana.AAC.3
MEDAIGGASGSNGRNGSVDKNNNKINSSSSGFKTNLSGLAEARSTVMSMTLDKMSDSISGQTVVDPSVKIALAAEVGDVNKARLFEGYQSQARPRVD